MNRVLLAVVILGTAVAVVLVGLNISFEQSITAPAPSETKLKLQLKWFSQSQFVGFYVAKAKPFYERKGLDVTIEPGGYNVSAVNQLRAGHADIAIIDGDQALLEYAKSGDIVAIGAVFNKSAVCFMSKASSNIQNVTDLRSKKVASSLFGVGNRDTW